MAVQSYLVFTVDYRFSCYCLYILTLLSRRPDNPGICPYCPVLFARPFCSVMPILCIPFQFCNPFCPAPYILSGLLLFPWSFWNSCMSCLPWPSVHSFLSSPVLMSFLAVPATLSWHSCLVLYIFLGSRTYPQAYLTCNPSPVPCCLSCLLSVTPDLFCLTSSIVVHFRVSLEQLLFPQVF